MNSFLSSFLPGFEGINNYLMIYKSSLYWIFLIAIIFYGSISLGSHFFFNTNAWDLGIFNQTLWQYAHWSLWPNTLRHVDTLLADHVEILLFLFAPISFIFGSYTLLYMQLGMMSLWGYGIYKLAVFLEKDSHIIYSLCLYFTFFWLTQAFVFDYHNNVAAVWLIPWIYYFFLRKKFLLFAIVFLTFLLAKENMGILGVAISVSLYILTWDRRSRLVALVSAFISIAIFVYLIKFLIPLLNHGHYSHWEYSALGQDMASSLWFIVTHPIDSFLILFDTREKFYTFWLLMISWGFLLLQPAFLPVFLVLIAQKFLASNAAIAGFQFHYTVEFAPFIAMGLLFLSGKKSLPFIAYAIIIVNVILIVALPIYTWEWLLRYMYHYTTWFERRSEMQDLISQIPKNVSVSASNTIVPHISFRNHIFLFPEIQWADFIAVDTGTNNIWPFKSKEELLHAIEEISRDQYVIWYSGKYTVLFERKSNNTVDSLHANLLQ